MANTLTSCLQQVSQEQVTGSVLMGLLGLELANIYQNLTNIVLTITPKDCKATPAVLVNAHYDSAVGSPGQPPKTAQLQCTDFASTQAVMLHLAYGIWCVAIVTSYSTSATGEATVDGVRLLSYSCLPCIHSEMLLLPI